MKAQGNRRRWGQFGQLRRVPAGDGSRGAHHRAVVAHSGGRRVGWSGRGRLQAQHAATDRHVGAAVGPSGHDGRRAHQSGDTHAVVLRVQQQVVRRQQRVVAAHRRRGGAAHQMGAGTEGGAAAAVGAAVPGALPSHALTGYGGGARSAEESGR